MENTNTTRQMWKYKYSKTNMENINAAKKYGKTRQKYNYGNTSAKAEVGDCAAQQVYKYGKYKYSMENMENTNTA